MRERAERIGGQFLLESRPGQGSSMTLTVPAKLAFVDAGRHSSKFSIFPWKKGPSHA